MNQRCLTLWSSSSLSGVLGRVCPDGVRVNGLHATSEVPEMVLANLIVTYTDSRLVFTGVFNNPIIVITNSRQMGLREDLLS